MKWNMLCLVAVYTGVPLSNKLDANMAQRIHIQGDVFPQLFFSFGGEVLQPI